MQKTIRTPALDIAFEESGPPDGPPVILMHGFPDDVRAWDGVVSALVAAGRRVLVPWLRGYGPTRFLDPATPRSGEQAALGVDLLAFMDALGVARASLAGYDWGGRAACIVAALWPERVDRLVTVGGYNIQDISACFTPAVPDREHGHWYQWYFQTERGRAGLTAHRRDLCKLLWRLWSPNYDFDDQIYDLTAPSFQNPDFIDVVIHSYRHRHQAAPGDPAMAPIESRLAAGPPIAVPTVSLHGACDGVDPPSDVDTARHRFTGPYRRAIIPVAGHFLPREAPAMFIEALLDQ